LDHVADVRVSGIGDVKIEMNLENKRTAVLGLGGSGKAATMLLQRRGAHVTVFDGGFPNTETITSLEKAGVSVITAATQVSDVFDLAVVSPGIDPDSTLFQSLRRQSAIFIGEIELAFQFCERPVVAITGTNGKTTTTQLVEKMLNDAGLRTLACGNIGMPFSEAVERRNELDLFTVEVSSFQLETISTFRPNVAIWLNLTPDHLDRYQDVGEYRMAKLRIFENQQASDFAVVNYRDKIPDLSARTIRFSAYSSLPDLTLSGETIHFRGQPILNPNQTNLTGIHNTENLMAALGAAYALQIPWEKAGRGLKGYQLLPHRCEKVGEVEGVIFINDSKATNLDALAKALESQSRPVILIAGGKDKGFEFDSINALIRSKVKHAVLIGEMAGRIASSWSRVVPCSRAETLRDAVKGAQTVSQTGDTVLFSPGTSSFDMFKGYADRGNQFRKIIQELER
jgi:UDP-N-acetylmuramoylalanine--D-glutamate ligase